MRNTLKKINKFLSSDIRQKLLRQKRSVEEDIKALEKDDPVLNDIVPESSELGTDSWMADVHTRAVAAKQSLQKMLVSIKRSLINLKKGKYGKCDNCGKQIEEARLKAMPTATLCIACSKKTIKH